MIGNELLCIHVEGNGMSPVMPKTLVCFDLRDTQVVDGCVYAIEPMGQIRIKLVYSIPGGALRLSNYNTAEHQDETVSASEITSQAIKVIGRIFWTLQFLG
jgi:phage repressor protein C with HTH and peptisase S24 domain